ncbi:hypothetical protein [Laspinema olomoucense]|uniref:Uncharacterized protein n=1 Tax=Laspinema olomoucense D3b TaxID=2953688 RepID=A0ABT2N7M1_9CYAN|nr:MULTISPECIES: hypothetical protein [unclassified Laspinema]MCT7973586.1 hypothetical protein [Laspinema sp. D3d]MCT7978687.1 hypothetical protein [Laspinema sp. D3b]MCT7989369.1 hypothetical protein [Laspinema sp. D3a]MCT7992352.1 hypothetical protein [Laspinema sp. D3c]
MDSNTVFIIKVMVASAIVSAAIKYGGPLLAIPNTSPIALLLVCTPAAIIFGVLSWRLYFQDPQN